MSGSALSPFDEESLSSRAMDWLDRHRMLSHMRPYDILTQPRVDAILHPSTPVKKSGRRNFRVATHTRNRVASIIQRAGRDMSVPEVAEQSGLSSVATSRYLRQLVDRGDAVITPRHGRVGRPSHYYRWIGDP